MANVKDEKRILKEARENGVQFIRLQFTDLFGIMKNVAITLSQLEKALDINCVSYKTEIYHGKTVSCCKLMTDTNRGITPLYALSTVQNFYDLIDTGKKYGIEKDLKTMLSFDIFEI